MCVVYTCINNIPHARLATAFSCVMSKVQQSIMLDKTMHVFDHILHTLSTKEVCSLYTMYTVLILHNNSHTHERVRSSVY